MQNFTHWFCMGKYTFYVWSAYSLVGLALIANLLHIFTAHKRVLKQLRLNYNAYSS